MLKSKIDPDSVWDTLLVLSTLGGKAFTATLQQQQTDATALNRAATVLNRAALQQCKGVVTSRLGQRRS